MYRTYCRDLSEDQLISILHYTVARMIVFNLLYLVLSISNLVCFSLANEVVIHNDVDAAAHCMFCDVTISLNKCPMVSYDDEIIIKQNKISPVGYHVTCPLGVQTDHDTERLQLEGFLHSDGGLSGSYNITNMLTGTVKMLSYEDTRAEASLLGLLNPKLEEST